MDGTRREGPDRQYGVPGRAAMSFSASCSVAVVFGLAALSKPTLPIGRERGIAPATDQTIAVPGQVMC